MNKAIKIGVLQGGFSKEKAVSLKTAKAIIQALKDDGFEQVIPIDVEKGFVTRLIQENIDVAFNALHGTYGEDGTVQGLLESLHIPYTGANVEASSLCMNKFLSKLVLQYHKIDSPEFQYVETTENDQAVEVKAEQLGFPLVIKPCSEGSTYGLKIVNNKSDFLKSYEWCKEYGNQFLLERFIAGREITVSVLEGQCLPIIEIIPKSGFYDYEAKYTEGLTDFVCPAEFSVDLKEKINHVALATARALGVLDFSRVDMIVHESTPYVLEVNTLPGMTPTSLFPRAAKVSGVSFANLLKTLIDQALERMEKS